ESLAAIAGEGDVMTGPLQKQPDRDLHGRVVIHDQDVGHLKNLRVGQGCSLQPKSNLQMRNCCADCAQPASTSRPTRHPPRALPAISSICMLACTWISGGTLPNRPDIPGGGS